MPRPYFRSVVPSAAFASIVGMVSACSISPSRPPAALKPLPTPTSLPLATPATTAATPSPMAAVAPKPTGLIETTDKAKRQEELNVRVNPQTNLGRDPFTAIPGSVVIPELKLPPPIQPPIALPPPSSRPPARVPRYAAAPPRVKREAETVAITGAIEIGGTRYAIVSVGKSSQYVRAGQRVANGTVLVKRIEMSSSPRIVLQQNGIEYTRSVGNTGG